MLTQKTFVIYYGPHKKLSGTIHKVLDGLSQNIDTLEIDESVKMIIKRTK